MKAVVVITLMLLAGALGACRASTHVSSSEIRGQVVDAASGAPLQGAIVYAVWRAPVVPRSFMGHFSMQACYHAETATTGADGKFTLRPWRDELEFEIESPEIEIRAYKFGYRIVASSPPSAPANAGVTIPLAALLGGDRQQLEEIGTHMQFCDDAGESRKNLFPLLQTLYYDARRLPTASSHLQRIEQLREAAADAGIDKKPDDTDQSRQARKQRFIEEHLQ